MRRPAESKRPVVKAPPPAQTVHTVVPAPELAFPGLQHQVPLRPLQPQAIYGYPGWPSAFAFPSPAQPVGQPRAQQQSAPPPASNPALTETLAASAAAPMKANGKQKPREPDWDADKSLTTGLSSLEALVEWLKLGNFQRLIGVADKTQKGPNRKDNPTKNVLYQEASDYLATVHQLHRNASAVSIKYTALLRSWRAARGLSNDTGRGLTEEDLVDLTEEEQERKKENWLHEERLKICKDYDLVDAVFADAGGEPTCSIQAAGDDRDSDSWDSLRTSPMPKDLDFDESAPSAAPPKPTPAATTRRNSIAPVVDKENQESRRKRAKIDGGKVEGREEAMQLKNLADVFVKKFERDAAAKEMEVVELVNIEKSRLELEKTRCEEDKLREERRMELKNRRLKLEEDERSRRLALEERKTAVALFKELRDAGMSVEDARAIAEL
ncbi:hypothetical protein HK101_008229 [Irineochytrium annulatum]|nr:hypothetical protein HK101_008229 [Irineochytrium annulatum]